MECHKLWQHVSAKASEKCKRHLFLHNLLALKYLVMMNGRTAPWLNAKQELRLKVLTVSQIPFQWITSRNNMDDYVKTKNSFLTAAEPQKYHLDFHLIV